MKYYSDVLDKVFETEKELEAAEKADAEEKAKKEEAKLAVKKESAEVEDAFKARNAAKKAYNEKLIELRKAYNKVIADAKEAFEKGLEDASKLKDKTEVEFNTKLRKFQKEHQNYHITLKDGDNVVTLTSDNQISFPNIYKEFDDILDVFSSILKRF